jgi:hypothetical protein
MIVIDNKNYDLEILTKSDQIHKEISLVDHLNGFDCNKRNLLLDQVSKYALQHQTNIKIYTSYFVDNQIRNNYPNLDFYYSTHGSLFTEFYNYNIHPTNQFKNFICSFNKSSHVSRKLLVAILKRYGYFDSVYCSKNFSFSADSLHGHIQEYVRDRERLYNKFFLNNTSEEFFQTHYNIEYKDRHSQNIYNLEDILTKSFLNIVSETVATSYYPFITEKFLYSIVTRGLFVAYAQPGWHNLLERIYGFQKYQILFDYKFDCIHNPLDRLVELMCMLSKYSILNIHEWHDLYLMEKDTIAYNYDHYFSRGYLKCVEQYSNC